MHGSSLRLRQGSLLRALQLAPSLVAASVFVACGSPAPVVPPPAPAASLAVPEPTAPPSPVAEVPAPVPAAVSPFRKVGTLDTDASVFPRGPGSVFIAVGIDIVATAEGDGVTLRPTLQQAEKFPLRMFSQLTTVTKGSGDNVWAAWIFPEGRMGATLVERNDGKKWSRGTRSRNAYTINQLFTVAPGRMLAIQEAQMFPDDAPRVLAVEGAQAGVPQVSKRPTKAPRDVPSAANLLFVPNLALGSSDGGVHLVGNPFPLTEAEIVRPMYETFDARGKSKAKGELDVGVVDKTVPVSVTANALAGGPVLLIVEEGARETLKVSLHLLRGGKDKPESVRIEGLTGTLTSAAADAKGNVYVLTAGATTSLFRVGADGKALPLVLPDGFALGNSTPPAVMATGPDDIWLFAAANGKLDVFRTKPNAPAIDVTLPNPQAEIFAKMEKAEEAAAAKAQAKEKLVFAKAYSSKCATPFVLLYTLAKTAPADYDFPATRDALKGHTELAGASFIEFSRGGKRFFGAVVPSGALGQKLVDAVKGKVVGSTPQLVCDGPAPDRTLAIDLATGKIKPLARSLRRASARTCE